MLSLPFTCNDAFIDDLFNSRYTPYVKFKIVADKTSKIIESRMIKKIAFVELYSFQDLTKILKWHDLYYKANKRVVIELANFMDFQQCMDYNKLHEKEIQKIFDDYMESRQQTNCAYKNQPSDYINSSNQKNLTKITQTHNLKEDKIDKPKVVDDINNFDKIKSKSNIKWDLSDNNKSNKMDDEFINKIKCENDQNFNPDEKLVSNSQDSDFDLSRFNKDCSQQEAKIHSNIDLKKGNISILQRSSLLPIKSNISIQNEGNNKLNKTSSELKISSLNSIDEVLDHELKNLTKKIESLNIESTDEISSADKVKNNHASTKPTILKKNKKKNSFNVNSKKNKKNSSSLQADANKVIDVQNPNDKLKKNPDEFCINDKNDDPVRTVEVVSSEINFDDGDKIDKNIKTNKTNKVYKTYEKIRKSKKKNESDLPVNDSKISNFVKKKKLLSDEKVKHNNSDTKKKDQNITLDLKNTNKVYKKFKLKKSSEEITDVEKCVDPTKCVDNEEKDNNNLESSITANTKHFDIEKKNNKMKNYGKKNFKKQFKSKFNSSNEKICTDNLVGSKSENDNDKKSLDLNNEKIHFKKKKNFKSSVSTKKQESSKKYSESKKKTYINKTSKTKIEE